MSGFTTTGASVVTNVDAVDRSLLMWRQFTQWLGGMGIIVLALAVLPRLRVGGRQLLESELPGPEIDQLADRIRDTARRLWLLYVALTARLFAILAAIGFLGDERDGPVPGARPRVRDDADRAGSPRSRIRSRRSAPAAQWVIVVFMLVAGVNFALLYARLRAAHAAGCCSATRSCALYLGAARGRRRPDRRRALEGGVRRRESGDPRRGVPGPSRS